MTIKKISIVHALVFLSSALLLNAQLTQIQQLIEAAANGYNDKVKFLLKENADIINETSAAALLIAAENGHKDTVKILLQNNADINIKDDLGWTALHKAASKGHKETVELLLQNNADVNAELHRKVG